MTLDQILKIAEEIATEIAEPEAQRNDLNPGWMADTMAALKRERLTALVVPSSMGGLGYGLSAVAKVCEVLGKKSGSAGLCFGMHCVATAVIASKATEEQQKEFLEPIARGEHITTLALSEPGTGSHFYFPQSILTHLNSGQLSVKGEKTFVTNGGFADSYVVSVAGSSNAESGEFSCVVIPKDAKGLEWKGKWEGVGMRGNSSIACKLDDVIIPESHLLGDQGDQLWYVFNVVAPYFLIAMAGTYLGIASSALAKATEHAKNRFFGHSGQGLSEISTIQYRFGKSWSELESARRLIYAAAEEADKANATAVNSLLACKAFIAEVAVRVVNDSMTYMGGMAYRDSSVMNRYLRDVRAADVMAPTTDILYTWVGRSILEMPLLSE